MKMKYGSSKIVLIISNLIPLYGVLFLGWNSATIIITYWMENIIVGIINILKIIKAKGKFRQEDSQGLVKVKTFINIRYMNKFELIISFILNYGIFTLAHGVFIKNMFGIPNIQNFIIVSFFAIFLSHLISYKINFINRGEYLKTSPAKLFNQPYKRMIVMHLTILFGGIIANGLGNPLYALIIMIIIKIIIDLYLHQKEHNNLNSPGVNNG